MRVSLLSFLPLWLAAAGAPPPAIVGSWDCVATDERGTRSSWTLTVAQAGEGITGSLRSSSTGDMIDLVDPKFEGKELRFQIRINPTETVQLILALDGDRLSGKFSGKDSGTGTLRGTRSVDVSGKWSGDWEIGPDGGPGPHYMILKQNGDEVTGTAGPNPDMQIAIQNGAMRDGHLTFKISVPGGPSLRFDFAVEREAMRGVAVLAINGGEQNLKLGVKRVAAP